MPFLVAGDPDFKTSLRIAKLFSSYADFLEIGFPYSDPLADGPVIQAADNRALRAGMYTDQVFNFIRQVRKFTPIPITVLVYANLVYRNGINRFYKEAARAGVDGVLVPDVPVEESKPFVTAARVAKITPIFMVTQTTDKKRLRAITKPAAGHLYLVSVLGVTGQRQKLPCETFEFIKFIRKHTNLPLAVGFGVANPDHIRKLKHAGIDGVIVGSALIKIIEANKNSKSRMFVKLKTLLSRMSRAT